MAVLVVSADAPGWRQLKGSHSARGALGLGAARGCSRSGSHSWSAGLSPGGPLGQHPAGGSVSSRLSTTDRGHFFVVWVQFSANFCLFCLVLPRLPRCESGRPSFLPVLS